jgi:HAE1 family hydrophobic/amphiphilic exporter-1
VHTAFGQANVDSPKGTLNSPRQTYTLNTDDQMLTADQYGDLVIAYRNGPPSASAMSAALSARLRTT